MRKIISLATCVVLASCAPVDYGPTIAHPNRQYEATPTLTWNHGAMISAANPLAVDAGLEILRAGGSAVDAAIAVQTALGLVEAQSSGIGGGAFMIYYDAHNGNVTAYDGREVAPMGATPNMFLDENGRPLDFFTAAKSGRSTGTPGVIAMLHMAHQEHGKLPWAESFKPAAKIARDGWPLTARMAGLASEMRNWTEPGAGVKAYLYDAAGNPYPAGYVMKNPEYARSLDDIGRDYRVMYDGRIAQDIVAETHKPPLAGTLTMQDMRAYRPLKKEPICRTYRVHLLCGMGPPSSGGIGTMAILRMLENFDMAANRNTALGWHLFIEAQRLAYIDRDTYVADDRFVNVPVDGLLDADYLKARAALISPTSIMAKAEAGNPRGARRRGEDATNLETGTTHFVIVDNKGNVVSMTTTVENIFGSQRMVDGFFINNQLTDFSFAPVDTLGRPIVNAIAPGKKPRSSMSPTIVFDEHGKFELAVGSPGGNAIIAYVAKALIGMLDWGLTPQEAVGLPNVIARRVPTSLEAGRFNPATQASLEAMGHRFKSDRDSEGSGLHAVQLTPNGLVGGADPRREGKAQAQ